MRDMKRVVLSKRSRAQMLHVETDGCVINITRGLHTRDGQAVTSVEIICDETTDSKWLLPDFDNRKGVNVRVVEQPED